MGSQIKKDAIEQEALADVVTEPKLTPKQQRFVGNLTNPESPGYSNATRSAELAGYKGKPGGNQLAVQGHVNLRNAKVRRAIETVLDRAGCTPELGAKRLRQALDATQLRVFAIDGEWVYSKPLPDYRERRLATELLFRLREPSLSQSDDEQEAQEFPEEEAQARENLLAADEAQNLTEGRDPANRFPKGSLLGQLVEVTSEAHRLQEQAEREGDLRTALAAVREQCRILELAAKLRGELAERAETKILNVTLDPETAKRIAETFLARHETLEIKDEHQTLD